MIWAAFECNVNIPVLRRIVDVDTGEIIAEELLYHQADSLVEEHNACLPRDLEVLINPARCFSVAPAQ